MSAEFDNLVRAVELACRHINPPHHPNILRFPLSDLGAEILKDQIESPEWKNTYLRGIEEKALKSKRPPLTPLTVRADNTGSVSSALTALADGRIASGGRDTSLQVWREASGQWQRTELTGHTNYVSALTTLADSRIVSGSLDKTLRVWGEVNGQWQSIELSAHTDFVNALTTLTDHRIVSGSSDKTLRVWSEVSGQWQSVELTGHSNAVIALTTLADGRVVSGSYDNTLRVWREVSGQWQSVELTGHTNSVGALATLADGRIISGSQDNTLRVWRETNGQWQSVELSGHTRSVYALTTLPDGRIVSGSGDKTLRVWREVGKEWQSEVVASTQDFFELARRPGHLLSVGEAIMIWTIPPTGHARKVIRLLVADGAISIIDYNGDGSIKLVRITPSEADREWKTTFDSANPQGKPLPCDPLLHQHAAFVDANEQRFEVWDCPDQFDWEGLTENGARTLVLYGTPQTK